MLQHGQEHHTEEQRVSSSPPSDGQNFKPGTEVMRDGSIRSLVNCYENKVEEVTH